MTTPHDLLQTRLNTLERMRRKLESYVRDEQNVTTREGLAGGETLLRTLIDANATLSNDVNSLGNGEEGNIRWTKLVKDYNVRLAPTIIETVRTADAVLCAAKERLGVSRNDDHARMQEKEAQAEENRTRLLQQQQQQHQSHAKQQQTMVVVNDSLESRLRREETEALRAVENRAEQVSSLTSKVATIVANSREDADKMALNTKDSRADVVSGLSELALMKKREAGKMTTRGTTVSALIGGAMGIVAGPMGMAMGAAAGAAVGAAVGSSLASLSRRSIDREVRAFKEKFGVKIEVDGTCETMREVYENQRWVPGVRGWSCDHLLPSDPSRWSDEAGETIVVTRVSTPMNPTIPPVVPDFYLEAEKGEGDDAPLATSSSHPTIGGGNAPPPTLMATGQDGAMFDGRSEPFINQFELESEEDAKTFAGKWRWAGPWEVDLTSKNTDIAGWSYAFSFGEGAVWVAAPSRTTFVRRRRWIRKQRLTRADAKNPAKIARVKREREKATLPLGRGAKSGELLFSEPAQAKESVSRATSSMTQSLDASGATLEELKRQGIAVDAAAREVAIVRDAAKHAERVSRATEITGLLKNVLTPYPSSSSPDYRNYGGYVGRTQSSPGSVIAAHESRHEEVEQQSEMSGIPSHHHQELGGEELPTLETLERMCEEQLAVAGQIQAEVHDQSAKLDAISETYDEAQNGVRGVMRKNFASSSGR